MSRRRRRPDRVRSREKACALAVFAINAAVLTAAMLALVFSSLTVGSPVALTERVVLAAGLVALLVVNLALLGACLRRSNGCRASRASVDPLRSGSRVPVVGGDARSPS